MPAPAHSASSAYQQFLLQGPVGVVGLLWPRADELLQLLNPPEDQQPEQQQQQQQMPACGCDQSWCKHMLLTICSKGFLLTNRTAGNNCALQQIQQELTGPVSDTSGICTAKKEAQLT